MMRWKTGLRGPASQPVSMYMTQETKSDLAHINLVLELAAISFNLKQCRVA